MEGIPKLEKGPEQIPTKDEVMSVIESFAENAQIVHEYSDEKGLYFLEAKTEDESGDLVEYYYTRKGRFPNGIQAFETTIHCARYHNGVPCSGDDVAVYSNGKWVNE